MVISRMVSPHAIHRGEAAGSGQQKIYPQLFACKGERPTVRAF
jgi:hypothetical protein